MANWRLYSQNPSCSPACGRQASKSNTQLELVKISNEANIKKLRQMTEEEKYKELIEEQADNPIEATSLWKKLAKYAQRIGLKAVYSALLLYYAFRRKETPAWAKRIITGILAYFIAPIDAIPDLTPFLGFTDDLGILGFGLATIAAYINKDVRLNARAQLEKWFDNIDEKELDAVDKTL